jgi:hypothetical protein
MSYLGDFLEDSATLNFKFTTRTVAGVPFLLAGSPVISIYRANGATPSVAGITLSVDFDSVAGLNNVLVDLSSDDFYQVWKDYQVVITAGTVNGVSVVGEVVAEFSIENRNTKANVVEISGDSTAADNLESQYDATGLSGGTFPSTQDQIGGIANVGSAVHKPASSYTLTTGTQSANGVADTEALDGTRHEHTDDAGALLIEYHFLIGSGTASSVQFTGYLTGNNDDIDVFAYDWVSAGYKQIGTIEGSASTTNAVLSFDLFVDMVGSGGDEGKVDIKLSKASGLTGALLAVDQIFVAFSQGVEGYDNGSVWADSGQSNTNTEVGIDGVARKPVSTVGAINTLLASTNLHRVVVAPGSAFTFAASQTDEIWTGRDWSLALGGQNITGSFIFGSDNVSGVGTATAGYEFEECDLQAVTMDKDGHFERCAINGTFTLAEAGVYTFHDCFSEAAGNVAIDFASIGGATVHLFGFYGDVAPTNMSAGDTLQIIGGGKIVTATCTGGMIDYDGTFQYTDAGGNVTATLSDIQVETAAIVTDLDNGTDGLGALKALIDALPTAAGILTTQMTESYANDGTAPTLAQALCLITAYLMERSVANTTVTAKKLDGLTTAATFAIDDATNPTSVTRVS